MKYKYQSECMSDECRAVIFLQGNCVDGIRCPKCSGPVSTNPYKPKSYQVSERGLFVRRKIVEGNLEFCRGLTPEQVDTVLSLGDRYKEDACSAGYKDGGKGKAQDSLIVELGEGELVKPIVEAPLLQIELKDIDSAPSVFYKGEEINKKIRVFFDYGTDTDEYLRPTYIHIEHFDTDSEKKPNTKIIQHNHPIEE